MKRTRKRYSQSFRRQVLEDYFACSMSQSACSQKWNVSSNLLCRWLRTCRNQEKIYLLRSDSPRASDKTGGNAHSTLDKAEVSFNPFLHQSAPLSPKSNYMDAKDQAFADLRAENERLLREAAYYKLRSTGYERLLEIVKEEDGIDLLKKDDAKQ